MTIAEEPFRSNGGVVAGTPRLPPRRSGSEVCSGRGERVCRSPGPRTYWGPSRFFVVKVNPSSRRYGVADECVCCPGALGRRSL